MKAGVKEGDRIIKVSEIPSLGDRPPWGRGCRVTSGLGPSCTLVFSLHLSSAADREGGPMRVSSVP